MSAQDAQKLLDLTSIVPQANKNVSKNTAKRLVVRAHELFTFAWTARDEGFAVSALAAFAALGTPAAAQLLSVIAPEATRVHMDIILPVALSLIMRVVDRAAVRWLTEKGFYDNITFEDTGKAAKEEVLRTIGELASTSIVVSIMDIVTPPKVSFSEADDCYESDASTVAETESMFPLLYEEGRDTCDLSSTRKVLGDAYSASLRTGALSGMLKKLPLYQGGYTSPVQPGGGKIDGIYRKLQKDLALPLNILTDLFARNKFGEEDERRVEAALLLLHQHFLSLGDTRKNLISKGHTFCSTKSEEVTLLDDKDYAALEASRKAREAAKRPRRTRTTTTTRTTTSNAPQPREPRRGGYKGSKQSKGKSPKSSKQSNRKKSGSQSSE